MNAAPWSFSKLKAFQQCPKQFYHEKVIKQYPFKMTEAVRYGDQFHKAAENYIREGTPLPERFKYAQKSLDILNAKEGDKLCEYRMGLTKNLDPCGFGARGVWWRGIADLVIVNVDEELAWVVDYKTSKSSQYADKGQLELMALALFKHFPFVKKVRGGLLFVVCEDFVKDTYTSDQEDNLWTKWVDDIESMETAFRTEVWNPKPNGLCKRHCPVIECPHNGSY
jgi:hypothetical protein